MKTSRTPRNCCPNHYRSAFMYHSLKQAFRNSRLPWHSPNTNLAYDGNNVDNTSEHIGISSHQMSRFYDQSHHLFCLLALFSVIKSCSTPVDVGFVKHLLDCFYGNGLPDEY